MQDLIGKVRRRTVNLVRRVQGALVHARALGRHRRRLPGTIARLIVVNMDNIGDVLLSTPALRALRRRFPDARISMVVSEYAADVVRHSPNVDELIVLPSASIYFAGAGKKPSLADILVHSRDLVACLARQRFDLGLVFEVNEQIAAWASAVLFLAGVRYRIGWVVDTHTHLLSVAIPRSVNQHRLDDYLDLVRFLGANEDDRHFDLFVSDEDAAFADALLRRNGLEDRDLLIGIHPGAIRYVNERRWSVESYHLLASTIIARTAAKLLVTGSRKDTALAERIASGITRRCLVAAGQTTVGQLAALLRCVQILVTNDTGALHVAYAIGVPKIVVISGPSDPRRYAPPAETCVVLQAQARVPCVPCEVNGLEGDRAPLCSNSRGQECLSAVTVDEVLSVIDGYLASVGMRHGGGPG
jgi:heptosyltransferase-2